MRVVALSIGLIIVAILLAAQVLKNPDLPVRAREFHTSSKQTLSPSQNPSGSSVRARSSEVEGQSTLAPGPLSSVAQRLSQMKSDDLSEEQNEALTQAIDALRAEELPGLLEEIEANPERFTPELYALLYRHWAEVTPQKAFEFALQLTEPSTQLAALEQTAIAWANEDSIAAQDWLSGLAPGTA